jgi:hypothetical protein
MPKEDLSKGKENTVEFRRLDQILLRINLAFAFLSLTSKIVHLPDF